MRPSEIDIFLAHHPEHKDAALSKALEIGTTISELYQWLSSIGCKTSRSATARWRLVSGHRFPGPVSNLRQQVVREILIASEDKLSKILSLLKNNGI